MAHAYTPGLKVTERTLVSKKRILPLKGDVLVKVGDLVDCHMVVARTDLPGQVKPINAANILGVPPSEVKDFALIKEGVMMEKGTIYVLKKSFFGLFKTKLVAEERCMIESINPITGNILLRAEPIPVEVTAYIDGEVVEVFPREGVRIQVWASFVQGIFGIGGETHGELHVVVPSNKTKLTPELITPDCRGKIIVGGNLITAAAVQRGIELGVRGIIAGGLHDKDLRQMLGYDLGVAITGSEELGITLMVTEGFGEIDMAERTFNLLKAHEGEQASINGATQIRAGVIRPEVVIPKKGKREESEAGRGPGSIDIGDVVQVIRAPFFGSLGTVVALPPELQVLESESKARVLEIEFSNGERSIIPRANIEMIEE
jgi:hypothetical protein